MPSGSRYEYQLKNILEDYGWFVTRSSGSNGVDLVALHPLYHGLIIEVKSVSGNAFYISTNRKQNAILSSLAGKGFIIIYAIRFKNREWGIYEFKPGKKKYCIDDEHYTLDYFK